MFAKMICKSNVHYSNEFNNFIVCHHKLSFHFTIHYLISFQDSPGCFVNVSYYLQVLSSLGCKTAGSVDLNREPFMWESMVASTTPWQLLDYLLGMRLKITNMHKLYITTTLGAWRWQLCKTLVTYTPENAKRA